MTDALTLCCPSCRTAKAPMLGGGASLQGASCPACGGTLLPTAGSERLLQEELALDRAALLELAESFGGRRFVCPWCKAKMRSLILRGVDVDLCFHCGALWLDKGELERLSNNRHHGVATRVTTKTTAPVRPQASLRLDNRHPLLRGLGRILAMAGIGIGAGVGFHLLAPATAVFGAALVAAGLVLGRRRVVDVFPRARRLLRSRRLLPTDPLDKDAERLDDRTFVMVRPLGPRHLASSTYVDSCGRSIASLDNGRIARVSRQAQAHAQRLGATLVFDSRLQEQDDDLPAPGLPSFTPIAFLVLLRPGPSTFWTFEAVGLGREVVFTMQNAVPARGNESASERLALCFCIEVPQSEAPATRLRLHDDGRGYSVVVGDAGEPLGAIHRRAVPHLLGTEWLTLALAGAATRLHLVLPPLGMRLPFFDDAGCFYGHVSLHHGSLEVQINDDVNAEQRFACCLLAAHAALDAGRLLEI